MGGRLRLFGIGPGSDRLRGTVYRVFLSALCALLVAGCSARQAASGNPAVTRFAAEVDSLRKDLRIPGLAAAIVRDRNVVWAGGFGYADLALRIPATPHTPFHIASLTKPVAATVLMQLVDKGLVRLDDPLTKWGIRLGSSAQVRNLLSHSTGGGFQYDSARYALMGGIIGRASGAGFERRLYDRVLKPLAMRDTATNTSASWESFLVSLGLGERRRSAAGVYTRLARPYRVTDRFAVVSGTYSLEQSPSAGLMSSALDLAALDIALDGGVLMRAETRELMWRPVVRTSELDASLWYASGWFVQHAYGTRLVWHYGIWPPSVSALWLKVPEQGLTLVMLANTDGLSSPFPLGEGDVLTSAFALAFVRSFVYPRVTGRELPAVNWKAAEADLVATLARVSDPVARDLLERELWSRRQVYASAGRWDLAGRLLRVQRAAFPGSWRAGDRRFVTTFGGFTPPGPAAIGVWGIVWGGRAVAAWLLLSAVALVLLLSGALPRRSLAQRLPWLPVVVVFGPIGLVACAIGALSRLTAALGEALGAASWLALCLLAAIAVVVGTHPAPGLSSALLPAGFAAVLAGLLVRRALRSATALRGYLTAVANAVVPELVATGIIAAVASPVFLSLERVWFPGGTDAGSPLFWLAIPVAAGAGAAVLLPVLWWAMRRGADRDDAQGSRLRGLRTAWPALIASAAVVAGSALLVLRQLR